MEFVRHALLFLHLVGMASLVGGFFVQLPAKDRVVNNAMLHGALTQAVTGVLLVGVIEGMDDPVNNAKIGVKAAVALVVLALCLSRRRAATISEQVYFGVGVLALANVAVAVFWT
jgi:hypothetical protein